MHDTRLGDSRLHRLDPRAKLLASVGVTVVAVATPLALWPVWIACAAVLVATAIAAHLPFGMLWRRARAVLPLVLFVAAFLPFVREGETVLELGPLSVSDAGLETFASVSAKAIIGTASAVLLSATTSFPAILDALASLRVPRPFVLTAQLTWRYLFVITGEVQRTRTSMAARGYRPRHALQAAVLGRAAGTLFLRSYARGERVHLAMLSRGYRP